MLMGALNWLRTGLSDVRHFGLGAVGWRLRPSGGNRLGTLSVPQFGRIYLRAGDSDLAVIRQTFAAREYQFPAGVAGRFQARYQQIIDSGRVPLIVDAGANIGTASLWFASLFPKALIAAVEPDPGNAEVLRRNIEGRGNIRMFEAAIGGEPGCVALKPAELGWAVQTERSASGLPVVTIDQLCEETGGELFLVKIDIEGFERDLFATNTGWVERCFGLFIEPHDWMLPGEMSSRTFQQVLSNQPFELFLCGENLLYARV